jgi:hypothetical protein
MGFRTTGLDKGREEEAWCDHREPGAEADCRKGGIAVGGPGPDGRAPHVCTAGHHFFWPREVSKTDATPGTTR